ncbi:unnamed protein product [Amoebophrya sp. A25]|nr:unnamed protein product [Amoebophrya sp. A25]|eukprot:GSA25T00025514001.1
MRSGVDGRPVRPSDQKRRGERPPGPASGGSEPDRHSRSGGGGSQLQPPGGSRGTRSRGGGGGSPNQAGGAVPSGAAGVAHPAPQQPPAPQVEEKLSPVRGMMNSYDAGDDVEEVDYDEDFEEASDDDDYVPQPMPEVKARPPSGSVIRPLSASAKTLIRPTSGFTGVPPAGDLNAIKQAMEQERQMAAPMVSKLQQEQYRQQQEEALRRQQEEEQQRRELLRQQEEERAEIERVKRQQRAAAAAAQQAAAASGGKGAAGSTTANKGGVVSGGRVGAIHGGQPAQEEFGTTSNFTAGGAPGAAFADNHYHVREKDFSPKSNPRSVVLTATQYTSSAQELSRQEKAGRAERCRELRALIGRKLQVEKGDIFSQRPQRRLELFLNARGPYAARVTRGMQTGEELLEEGCQTEKERGEEKETQCPTLGGRSEMSTSSSSGSSGSASTSTGGTAAGSGAATDGADEGETLLDAGSAAQLLPFLRRVLPLFEASLKSRTSSASSSSSKKRKDTQICDSASDAGVLNQIGFEHWTPTVIQSITGYLGSPHVLAAFDLAPETSVYSSCVVVYAADALAGGSGGKFNENIGVSSSGGPVRAHRVFYSFEKITCMSYFSACSVIVCGTAAGSLLLFDMRKVVSATSSSTSSQLAGTFLKSSPGVIEEPPTYSTDIFALHSMGDLDGGFGGSHDVDMLGTTTASTTTAMQDHDDATLVSATALQPPFLGEIVSVATSKELLFVLDVAGSISSWRLLDQDPKLVYIGPTVMDKSGPLAARVVAVPREISPQSASYVVLSLGGGPPTCNGNHDVLASAFEPPVSDTAGSPHSAVFHPVFASLLLIGYLGGDVALYDTTLAVPLLHFKHDFGSHSVAGRPSKGAKASMRGIAWSPVRPTVFFVLTGAHMQIWDLAVSTTSFAENVALPPNLLPSGFGFTVLAESGRPLYMSKAGCLVLMQVPEKYTTPLKAYPTTQPHLQNNKMFDSRNNLFDTRNKDSLAYMRKVLENKNTKLEIDILHKVLLMA